MKRENKLKRKFFEKVKIIEKKSFQLITHLDAWKEMKKEFEEIFSVKEKVESDVKALEIENNHYRLNEKKYEVLLVRSEKEIKKLKDQIVDNRKHHKWEKNNSRTLVRLYKEKKKKVEKRNKEILKEFREVKSAYEKALFAEDIDAEKFDFIEKKIEFIVCELSTLEDYYIHLGQEMDFYLPGLARNVKDKDWLKKLYLQKIWVPYRSSMNNEGPDYRRGWKLGRRDIYVLLTKRWKEVTNSESLMKIFGISKEQIQGENKLWPCGCGPTPNFQSMDFDWAVGILRHLEPDNDIFVYKNAYDKVKKKFPNMSQPELRTLKRVEKYKKQVLKYEHVCMEKKMMIEKFS